MPARSFAALICAIAAGFGTPALATEADAVRGETAYAAACASCHANASRLASRANARGADELEAFLAGHYAEDPQMRADIRAYLLSL